MSFSGTVTADGTVATGNLTANQILMTGTGGLHVASGLIDSFGADLTLQTDLDLEMKSTAAGTIRLGNGAGTVELHPGAGNLNIRYAATSDSKTAQSLWLPIRVNGTTYYLRLWQ